MKISEKSLREIQELKERREKEVTEYEDRVLEITKQRENEEKIHASTVKDLEDKVAEQDRQVGIQCLVIFLLETFHTGLMSLKDPKHS